MRRKLLAANWKLYKTISEARAFAQAADAGLRDMLRPFDIALCAAHTLLAPLAGALAGTGIVLGAQNVSEHIEGAYTGETGIKQLSELDIGYVILGHSERRNIFGESDELVRKKLEVVLSETEISPILCVGESLPVREKHGEVFFVREQIEIALSGIPPGKASRIVIAYEPIWAIGTGVNAAPEDAESMCTSIREVAAHFLDADTAAELRILYGGSIKPGNWDAILAGENVDGGLVGGASLTVESFLDLCRITAGHSR